MMEIEILTFDDQPRRFSVSDEEAENMLNPDPDYLRKRDLTFSYWEQEFKSMNSREEGNDMIMVIPDIHG